MPKDEGERIPSIFFKNANSRFSSDATPPASFPPHAPGAKTHSELVPVTAATWKSMQEKLTHPIAKIAHLTSNLLS
jgi:hypothetical protein